MAMGDLGTFNHRVASDLPRNAVFGVFCVAALLAMTKPLHGGATLLTSRRQRSCRQRPKSFQPLPNGASLLTMLRERSLHCENFVSNPCLTGHLSLLTNHLVVRNRHVCFQPLPNGASLLTLSDVIEGEQAFTFPTPA